MPKLISVDKKLNVIESYENKKEYNLTTSNVCDIFLPSFAGRLSEVSRKSIYNWRKKISKNIPLHCLPTLLCMKNKKVVRNKAPTLLVKLTEE